MRATEPLKIECLCFCTGVRWSHSTLRPIGSATTASALHHVAPAGAVLANLPLRAPSQNEGHEGAVHERWYQSRHFRTDIRSLKESKNTAEDCDRIVEEMRYRNIKVPRQLEISWRRRVEGWVVGGFNAGRAVVKFCFSLPGMLFRTVTMSPSEWYKFLTGLWGTIKHEADYYWVRLCCLFNAQIQLLHVCTTECTPEARLHSCHVSYILIMLQVGFKLFGFELRVASGLVWKKLKGGHLSRRERRQLTRTSADLIRVIPFSLFIIIPFAEALLPLAIRLFPNLLPSTFESPLKRVWPSSHCLSMPASPSGSRTDS